MPLSRLPDLPSNYLLEDIAQQLAILRGVLMGQSPHGVSTYFTQADNLGTDGAVDASLWGNTFSTTESTLGQAIRALDGADNIILQGSNAGLYGELDWETTQNMVVGVDLTVGRDIAAGRDIGANRNLAVGNDAAITGDLAVTLTTTLTGNVGIGAAPDATVKAKITGGLWVTSDVGIKVTPSGDFGLEIADDIGPSTDNARDLGSSSKQWQRLYATNLTIDTDFLKVDKSANQITVDTDLLILDRSARTLTVGNLGSSVPLIAALEATGMVGIKTATPDAVLDIADRIRITGDATAPTTGEGLEIAYNLAGQVAVLRARVGATSALTNIRLNGLTVQLFGGGAEKLRVDGTGVGFFGNAPVARPAVSGTLTGATLGQLTTVVTNLINALDETSLGLITDSTT